MNKYIIISIILELINSLSASNLHARDIIDDENDIIPKECRIAITLNLDDMNSCVQLLQDKTLKENELNSLCESFEDYYAQDTESETEDEEETNLKTSHKVKDLTKEEEEALKHVNKVINDYIDNSENEKERETKKLSYTLSEKDKGEEVEVMNNMKENDGDNDNKNDDNKKDDNDKDEYKDDDDGDDDDDDDEKGDIEKRSYSNRKRICKIYVRKWKRKCKDLPRIESVLNAPLEYFYFRRRSYCLKNNHNRYCTVVMNEIKNRIYNETTKISLPLTDQEKNNTCECYKAKMSYYNEEYLTSTDSIKENDMKYYSKNRKHKQEDGTSNNKNKRNLNTNRNENENENNDNDSNDNNKNSANIFWKYIENIISQYFPATFGIHKRPKSYSKLDYYIPTYKDIKEKVKNGKMKDYSFAEILAQEIEKILHPNSDIFNDNDNNDNNNNNNHKIIKRMQTTDNIQKLRKLINLYDTEMNEYMEISTCNITFSEINSKNVTSNALPINIFSFYILISQLLISILFYLF